MPNWKHQRVKIEQPRNFSFLLWKNAMPVISAKFFSVSPKRNDILQTQMKQSLGKEITLGFDVKTRWNSIITMVETFSQVTCLLSIFLHPVLRIRDVYPGSWFLPIPDPGSKNSNKREGWKKFVVINFFVAKNITKLKII